MSILDTFYILFKSNTDEVKKGFDTAEAAGKKFDAGLGRTDEHVHIVGERIKDTFKEVGLAIAGAFAARELTEWISHTIEANARLNETSERLGVAVEDLAAAQAAAVRFGGSADGVTQSFDFLNRGLADLATKGTSRLLPFFRELGLEPVNAARKAKPLLEIYGELADKLSGKSAQERAGFAERFGIDPGFLLALSDGRKGFDELIAREKALGVTSKEDAEQASKFRQSLADVNVIMNHLATTIAAFILPPLRWLTDAFINVTQYLREHKGLVEGFFIGLGGVITAVYLPAVIRATAATLAFLAPYILIPAVIIAVGAAFALAYEDIKVYLEGGKSLTGELIKKFPILKEVIENTAGAINTANERFKELKETGAALLDFFSALGKFTLEGFVKDAKILVGYFIDLGKAMGLFTETAKSDAQAVTDAWKWVADVLGKIAGFLGGGFLNDVGSNTGLTGGLIHGSPGGDHASFVQALKLGAAALRGADASPLNAASSVVNTVGGARATSVQIDKIEVNAPLATNAEGIAAAMGAALKPHLDAVINQHDDGVAR